MYYVSTTGNDAHEGTAPEVPFATLGKAGAMLKPGDTLRLRRGEVFTGSLKLTVAGTADAPVTVATYGEGPKPILTGFRRVTGWSSVGSGRYEAALPETASGALSMVRIDDRVRAKGRWPKKGFVEGYRIQRHLKHEQVTTKGELPEVTGGEIVQKKYQWVIDRGRIEGMSQSGSGAEAETTVRFKDYPQTTYDSFDGNKFFIQNHVACLTEAGDWCVDPATRKITVYSGDAPPGEKAVEVAAVDHLIDLVGAHHVRVMDLALTGSNSDAVLLRHSRQVSFEGCEISCAGHNGLSVAREEGRPWMNESPHLTIRNCRISDVHNNGIDAGNNPHWTLVGNTVTNIGMHPGMGGNGDAQYVGIIAPGDESLIQYNEISRIGYNGLHFVGSGTQVRNNHVHHFCMVKSDGGGIYTYVGETRGSFAKTRIVERNVVHDGVGNIDGMAAAEDRSPYAPQCQGIYMDGNTTDVVVSRNTVYRVASSGLWLGSNGRIQAVGNTLANNHMMQLGIDDQTTPPKDLEVRDNLCVAFEPEQLCLSVSLRQKPKDQSWAQYVGSMGVLASNLYCRPMREPDGIRTRGYPHVPTFKDYTGGGVVSTSWDSRFLSLDAWQKDYAQDVGSRKTSRSVASPEDLCLEVNPTASPVVVELSGTFEDVRGTVYRDRLTIEPYSSVVLLRVN